MDSAPSPRGIAFDLHIASDSARLLVLSRAGVAQLAEHLICNQRVRGSNPFASSRKIRGSPGGLPANDNRNHIGGKRVLRETGLASADRAADVAQLVERVLGKDEVTGSIPVIGSRNF